MRCLVTGVAGFIGSHLAEALLGRGHTVAGVDCFTPYYARQRKQANLAGLHEAPGFTFVDADLGRDDLSDVLAGADWVFHQAGQPGVRASWGDDFRDYAAQNVLATQRLLDGLVRAGGVRGMVYASSSSIYGEAERLPTREDAVPQPISPYGVTKLAAEHLCRAYGRSYGFPVAALRYFTVYGPRQRPDMAFNKFIDAAVHGRPIDVYGDGRQTRDYTYVADVVAANVAAIEAGAQGVFNIGGGARVDLLEVLHLIETLSGHALHLRHGERQRGDVRHTGADTTAARERFGYAPQVTLREGLARQIEWQRGLGG